MRWRGGTYNLTSASEEKLARSSKDVIILREWCRSIEPVEECVAKRVEDCRAERVDERAPDCAARCKAERVDDRMDDRRDGGMLERERVELAERRRERVRERGCECDRDEDVEEDWESARIKEDKSDSCFPGNSFLQVDL